MGESTGQGVFRQEYNIPCLDCNFEIFEWSAWTTSNQGRISRARGNNTIVAGSYQEEDRAVGLVGGDGHSNGNVFVINFDGYYGPVCHDNWNDNTATIVCKELGFSSGTAKKESYFGNVPEQFAMDDVNCSGSEVSILLCNYRTFFDCAPSEGVG